jgi:hypothetical protein
MAGLYSIQSRSGMSYIGRVEESESGITLEGEGDKQCIASFNPSSKFIVLKNAYILVPTKGADGRPDVYPVKFKDTPTGGESVALSVDSINDINYLTEDNQFATALKAMDSNIVLANSGDVEKSSRLIHKFGK